MKRIDPYDPNINPALVTPQALYIQTKATHKRRSDLVELEEMRRESSRIQSWAASNSNLALRCIRGEPDECACHSCSVYRAAVALDDAIEKTVTGCGPALSSEFFSSGYPSARELRDRGCK